MRIELEGTTFCVTGNFDNHQNTRTVGTALEAGGGKVMKSMGQKVEVLVFGSGYTAKTQTARDRGIPILREAQLDELLDQGWVEIDFETPTMDQGDASIDELMGEARSALADPPSSLLWRRLAELVDRCSPEQLAPLVDYVGDHVERWPARAQLYCSPGRDWIAAMSRGEDSPAYQLLRRLDLAQVDMNSTGFKKIIGCASLTGLRALDMAVEKKLTKTAFRALSSDPKFASLEELTLGYFDEASVKELDTGGQLTNLHTLGCYPSDFWRVDAEWYRTLFELDACSRVERLVISNESGWSSSVADVFDQLRHPGTLPSLTHLEYDFVRFGKATSSSIDANTLTWSLARASKDAQQRIRTLTLRSPVQGYYTDRGRIAIRMLSSLEELRLFDAGPERSRVADQEDYDRVFHLDKMRLPESLRRVVTNLSLDSEPFARFAEKNPDVELVHQADA